MATPSSPGCSAATAGLQNRVRKLGFIASGSVVERYTFCTSPGCHCHADPPARHGPYYQHTRKIAGKTVTRRLTAEQADRYREQISNQARELPSAASNCQSASAARGGA